MQSELFGGALVEGRVASKIMIVGWVCLASVVVRTLPLLQGYDGVILFRPATQFLTYSTCSVVDPPIFPGRPR